MMLGLFKWLKEDERSGLHAEIIAIKEAEDREGTIEENANVRGALQEASECEIIEKKV